MAPENVVICIDNSKWSINGDFAPTRYINQLETAKAMTNQITASNPESKVAFINLASKRLVRSFSSSTEFLVEKLRLLDCEGDVDLAQGLQIANLVLNNCPDEHVVKRIIVFVGNKFYIKPYDACYLRYLFRENNVNVSIIQFGDKPSELTNLLNEMIENHKCKKSNLNHHYLFVKSNESNLRSTVLNSIICKNPNTNINASNNAMMYNDDLVDDELDEELQLALKLSRDEYNQKQGNTAISKIELEPEITDEDQQLIQMENEQEFDSLDADIIQRAREAGIDPSVLQDLNEDEREQLILALALSLEHAYNSEKESQKDKKENDDKAI